MRGLSEPRPKLKNRIEVLAAESGVSSHWLEKVGDAARNSQKFFKIVDAALSLVSANE